MPDDRARQRSPDDTEVLRGTAASLIRLGRADEAVPYIARAEALAPQLFQSQSTVKVDLVLG